MGSRSSSSSNSDLLNGLKFGKKIYFEDVGYGAPTSSAGGSSSAAAAGKLPPTPPKKGRTGGVVAAGQPPRCQVEGCNVDLSDVKAYYSRHKVCGTHSKAGEVVVAGITQRFCQQCSRFHQLPEFDSGKRSCRRRLAGHNERRRKPPPGSLLSSRFGRLTPSALETSRSGGFLMDFSTYPRFPGADAWPTTKVSDRISTSQPPATVKMRPDLWQRESDNPPPSGFFLQGGSSANSSGYSSSTIPSGECFAGVTTDSGRALSLLSNQQPWGSRHRSSSGNFLNSDDAPMVQSASTHGGVTVADHFSSNNSWGFKVTEGGGGSHEMGPDQGMSRIPYSGELELGHQSGREYMGLEHSRAYDSSTQHAHWSL